MRLAAFQREDLLPDEPGDLGVERCEELRVERHRALEPTPAARTPQGLPQRHPENAVAVAAVDLHDWEVRLAAFKTEWQPLRPPPPEPWSAQDAEHRVAGMRAEHQDLVRRGAWLGGPTSVLEVLDVHTQELTVTRVLAWFLRPDGRHGLHDAPLRHVLRLAGADADADLHPVHVVLEDSRTTVEGDPNDPSLTRADLVVYTRQTTLVVEAKMYAPEQRNQLDRLKRCWRDDLAPAFLYVTRHTLPQTTARREGLWPATTWATLGGTFAEQAGAGTATPEALALANSLRRIR